MAPTERPRERRASCSLLMRSSRIQRRRTPFNVLRSVPAGSWIEIGVCGNGFVENGRCQYGFSPPSRCISLPPEDGNRRFIRPTLGEGSDESSGRAIWPGYDISQNELKILPASAMRGRVSQRSKSSPIRALDQAPRRLDSAKSHRTGSDFAPSGKCNEDDFTIPERRRWTDGRGIRRDDGAHHPRLHYRDSIAWHPNQRQLLE